jgi:hypothetical protein
MKYSFAISWKKPTDDAVTTVHLLIIPEEKENGVHFKNRIPMKKNYSFRLSST